MHDMSTIFNSSISIHRIHHEEIITEVVKIYIQGYSPQLVETGNENNLNVQQ